MGSSNGRVLVWGDSAVELEPVVALLSGYGYSAEAVVCDPVVFASRIPDDEEMLAAVFVWSARLCDALAVPLMSRSVPVVVIDHIWRHAGAQEMYALGVHRYLSFKELPLLPSVMSGLCDRGSRREAAEAHSRTMERLALELAETEMRTQLSFAVLHDVANVLSGIEGKLRILHTESDSSQDELSVLERNCRRAIDLIRSSLLLTSEKASRECGVDVLDQISSLFRAVLPSEVRFEESVDALGVTLKLGAPELLQTVLNLLFNSRDAVLEQAAISGPTFVPSIRMEVRAESELLRLAVCDNGPGIPEEITTLVFEPGFTTKGEGHGNGLGLFSVKQVLERCGGTVAVRSSGGGTEIELTIPCTMSACEEPKVEVIAVNENNGATVLLVEDNETIASVLEESFRSMGFHLILAHDSISALKLLNERRAPVQIVVSDYSMPGPSGLELRSQVNAKWPETKFILCSGYAIPEQSGDAQELHLVRKPFHLEELVDKVQEVLGTAEKRTR